MAGERQPGDPVAAGDLPLAGEAPQCQQQHQQQHQQQQYQQQQQHQQMPAPSQLLQSRRRSQVAAGSSQPLTQQQQQQQQQQTGWLKQRQPDWKPRRASVASCQLCYLNVCKHEIKRRESSLLLPYNYNTTSSCRSCSTTTSATTPTAAPAPPAIATTSAAKLTAAAPISGSHINLNLNLTSSLRDILITGGKQRLVSAATNEQQQTIRVSGQPAASTTTATTTTSAKTDTADLDSPTRSIATPAEAACPAGDGGKPDQASSQQTVSLSKLLAQLTLEATEFASSSSQDGHSSTCCIAAGQSNAQRPAASLTSTSATTTTATITAACPSLDSPLVDSCQAKPDSQAGWQASGKLEQHQLAGKQQTPGLQLEKQRKLLIQSMLSEQQLVDQRPELVARPTSCDTNNQQHHRERASSNDTSNNCNYPQQLQQVPALRRRKTSIDHLKLAYNKQNNIALVDGSTLRQQAQNTSLKSVNSLGELACQAVANTGDSVTLLSELRRYQQQQQQQQQQTVKSPVSVAPAQRHSFTEDTCNAAGVGLAIAADEATRVNKMTSSDQQQQQQQQQREQHRYGKQQEIYSHSDRFNNNNNNNNNNSNNNNNFNETTSNNKNGNQMLLLSGCGSQHQLIGHQLNVDTSGGGAGGQDTSRTSSACDLEALIVESWLEDHTEFAHEYFLRRANRQLIDQWLLGHAKISNTNLAARSQSDVNSSDLQGGGGYSFRHSLSSVQARPAVRPGQPFDYQATSATPSEQQQQQRRLTNADFRSARSRSHSGNALGRSPVRKISATDLESCTGNGVLRPIVSTTPDGRPTFLSQLISNSSEQVRSQCPAGGSSDSRDVARRSQRHSIEHGGAGTEFGSQPGGSDGLSKRQSAPAVALVSRLNVVEPTAPTAQIATGPEGEVKMLFELVKSITDELDIRSLLHKILKNIAILINADKSSLFLVCGDADDPNRHLVSKLFNVDQDSELCAEPDLPDEADQAQITIPWGSGLVGYVAASGESVNISNCYEDPRFTNLIDQKTGYVTKNLLCAPIYDQRNQTVVGVAQVINKRNGQAFSESDERKFKQYLQFCGIGLCNAKSYERCQLENRRNEVLLDLARMVFEEQSTIEQVVYRIMLHTQSLLECQRCQVLIIDDGTEELDELLKLPHCLSQQSSTDGATNNSNSEKPPTWQPQCGGGSRSSLLQVPQVEQVATNEDDGDRELIETSPSKADFQDGGLTKLNQFKSSKLFSLIFDFEYEANDLVMHRSGSQECYNQYQEQQQSSSAVASNFPINIGITSYVAMTGETLNIEDAHKCDRFDPSVDENTNFKHKSILCMPIRNGKREIIGVSQLINKKNGRPFNKNDEHLFEAFAIFCGLGIHNTLMYERVLKIMAKQRVTFEVLSYHATAPLEEAQKLSLEQVPSCYALNLSSLKFNDFSLDDQYMLKACLRFFLDLDLIRRFQIDQLVLCNWILSVRKNYRQVTYHPIVGGDGLQASPVRYHNWRHAFNVSQMMFAILINTQICQALGELETLALLIACLCHDLDHRGTNNSFQIKSASPLAQLYSTSTMEHHHFDQCVMILNSQGNQILANLSPDEYSRVIVLLKEAILATDLANYFTKRDHFFKLVNSQQLDWQRNGQHRSMLRCMLMTACDVAAITKPWPVQKAVADLVMSEFYQQGDYEKQELKIEPIDMMNREKMSELPEMQIGFIDSVCIPIYRAFRALFPTELGSLLDGCVSNRGAWSEISAKQIK